MFFVSKAKQQIQKTPTTTGSGMNAVSVPFQWVSTSTEIAELSLGTPRPVATTE